MVKLWAILEVMYLSFMFVINGTWYVLFKDRRVDYQIILTKLPKKRTQICKIKFSELMKRITKG